MHVGPHEQQGRYGEQPGGSPSGQCKEKQQQGEKEVTEILRTSG